MQTKKVKIYSTPSCVYCIVLKKFLEEKGISFTETDVSLDENSAKEMIEKSGQMGVPVIEIDEEVIVGFNKDKITKLLNI
jgi:glutaredoxin 3